MVKNLPSMQEMLRDSSWIPGSGRSPGGRHVNPLQYSHLENPSDRGAWWVAKCWTQLKQLNTHTHRVLIKITLGLLSREDTTNEQPQKVPLRPGTGR